MIALKAALSRVANWLTWLTSWHTSVKWCRSSRPRISRIRSSSLALPLRQPSAYPESVG